MDTPKFVTNHQHMLCHSLHAAAKEYENAAIAYRDHRMGDRAFAGIQQNLARQYNKLCHMDHCDLLLLLFLQLLLLYNIILQSSTPPPMLLQSSSKCSSNAPPTPLQSTQIYRRSIENLWISGGS